MHISPVNSCLYRPNFESRKKKNKNQDYTYVPYDYLYKVHTGGSYPRRYLPQSYNISILSETYDSFTGLRDKNYLLKVINDYILKNKATKQDLSIAMFDMDNFKSVNELLGYKTGDDFIMEISKSIRDAVWRHQINAYRFGGEEFVVVFNGQQSQEERFAVSNEVIEAISNNKFIQSKSGEYIKEAERRLQEYIHLNSKISELLLEKTKSKLLRELQDNLETEEAKSDPYLVKSISEADSTVNRLYSDLINERIEQEKDESTQLWLKDIEFRFRNGVSLEESEQADLDEYLISIYDKTFEIHQLKRWIKDFTSNNGFSITGGMITLKYDAFKEKSPIDVINAAGEILKRNKSEKRN